MITIDGIAYDVPVVGIKRKGEFLYKYAERTKDGKLHSELIGVYFNYSIKFGNTLDREEYAALWQKLSEPVEFHTVIVPDEDGTLTFSAYFAGLSDEMRRQVGEISYWKNLTLEIIAQIPARTP